MVPVRIAELNPDAVADATYGYLRATTAKKRSTISGHTRKNRTRAARQQKKTSGIYRPKMVELDFNLIDVGRVSMLFSAWATYLPFARAHSHGRVRCFCQKGHFVLIEFVGGASGLNGLLLSHRTALAWPLRPPSRKISFCLSCAELLGNQIGRPIGKRCSCMGTRASPSESQFVLYVCIVKRFLCAAGIFGV